MSERADRVARRRDDPAELFEAARAGDRRALARALSLVERGGADARALAKRAFAAAGRAYSVGLTGAPGAGKSTLTASLIGEVRGRLDSVVAVLAVDPSSPLSGGAILGDRVRMQDHALDDGVFIRSLATRGHLGGLAAAVPEAVRLLDATGWPLVLVETVGVGQVEVEVAATCDTVVVVVNPGWGDSVQANKAGLLEVADILVVNKADRPGVRETKRDLLNMLELSGTLDWTPPILETVGSTGQGVPELLDAVMDHRAHLEASGRLERRRADRFDEEVVRLARAQLDELLAASAARAATAAPGDGLDPDEAASRLVRDVARRLAAGEAELGGGDRRGDAS